MAFKGKLEEFEITANVTGSFGAANLIASIDRVKILVKSTSEARPGETMTWF